MDLEPRDLWDSHKGAAWSVIGGFSPIQPLKTKAVSFLSFEKDVIKLPMSCCSPKSCPRLVAEGIRELGVF